MNGGKADNLERLQHLGFPVPAWVVLGPESKDDDLPRLLHEAGLDGVA